MAGPKELMKNLSLSENQISAFSVLSIFFFTKHLCLFALEVLFALSCWGKQPGCILFMHHNAEALLLVYLDGDQGDFDVYYPITFLPCSHCSSSSSIVLLHCRYTTTATFQCVIICGSEIYLSIFPFYRRYGTIYLYVLFFLCLSVHLDYIVHMQMI